jgi:hypothetical protein
VLRLAVTPPQMSDLQRAIAATLATHEGAPVRVAPGPHAVAGYSAFYESVEHYSALYTCNTWAARVLHAAGLPVTSSGVEFASQLWSQVQALQGNGAATPAERTRAP